MLYCRPLILALALAIGLSSAPAAAEPAKPPLGQGRFVASVVAGVLTVAGPLCLGSILLAQGTRIEQKQRGLDIMEVGLVLGPVVSHAIAGEGERAAIFGLPPLFAALATRKLSFAHPDIVEESTTTARIAFFAMMTVSVAATTVGLIDSLRGMERARRRLRILPTVGPGHGGLVLGGSL